MSLVKHFIGQCIVVGLVLVLAGSAGLQADTFYVDDNAPNDPGPGDSNISDPNEDGSATHPFDAIQEGIDVAFSGDEVIVADGTYTGTGNKDLDFGGKDITVRSEDGPHSCIIDCEYDGRAFYFHTGETANAVVDGFTIRNGYVSDIPPKGGGIHCEGAGPTITNCILENNTAEITGGGIFSKEACQVTVTNCTFAGNSTNDMAGALCCDSDTVIDLANCIFWDNSAPNGNQFATGGVGVLNVSYCDVQGGSADVYMHDGGTFNWLAGNIEVAPDFADPNSNDYHPAFGSPCIDAADNSAVPADNFDWDGDGDTSEPIPFDLDGRQRFRDDPASANTGNGTSPIVDMGAYEYKTEQDPDQFHLAGPIPHPVNIGSTGTILVTVQADFAGLPGWEVVFIKLASSFTFTAGTVSPDGMQASVWTNINGMAQMTFSADGTGDGLIGVIVTDTELPMAYSVFEIVPSAGLPKVNVFQGPLLLEERANP